MRSLELMYYVIRQQALAVRSSESDYLPSLALTIMLHPICYGTGNFLLGLTELKWPRGAGSSIMLERFGPWFYVSFIFSYLFVRLALDARQSQIDQAFHAYRPSAFMRIGFVFAAFIFSISSHYLNTISFYLSLVAFGLLLLVLHVHAIKNT